MAAKPIEIVAAASTSKASTSETLWCKIAFHRMSHTHIHACTHTCTHTYFSGVTQQREKLATMG